MPRNSKETSSGEPRRQLDAEIDVERQKFASRTERLAHKEKIGDDLVARYIKGTDYETMSLETMVQHIAGIHSEKESADMLKMLGIGKDKSGRFNLKNPERPGIPGSWEREERLKALLASMAESKNVGEQLRAIAKVYEYLGLPFNAAYELSPKEKKSPTLPLSTWKQLLGIGRAAAFAVSLLALTSPHASRFGSESRSQGKDTTAGETTGGTQGFSDEREARAESAAEKEKKGRLYEIKQGDRIWNITTDILTEQLGRKPSKSEIMLAAKTVCEQNGIQDNDLGVDTGTFNSTRLRPGMQIDVSAAYEVAEAFKAKT